MRKIQWGRFPLPLIQVNPPNLKKSSRYIRRAYINERFSNYGVLCETASDLMASRVNKNYQGILCNNNTTGILASLISVDVRNKFVVISNFTFVATFHAIVAAGGIPLIVDVNPFTYEMDFDIVNEVLRSEIHEIGAVVPTRVFGFVNDFTDLISICEKKGVPVIVDSAATYPRTDSTWNFNKLADAEIYSFHATKVFGIGEGGLVVGKANQIEKIIKSLNFGLDYNNVETIQDGINGKADEFLAARALTRLDSYPKDVSARLEFARFYEKVFRKSNVSHLPIHESTVYAYFPIKFKSERDLLKFREVTAPYFTTRRYYYPSLSNAYMGKAKYECFDNLEVSNELSRTVLCLPVYSHYSNKVLNGLEEIIKLALNQGL